MDIDKALFFFSILVVLVVYRLYRVQEGTRCRRSDMLLDLCGGNHSIARKAFQRRVNWLTWWESVYKTILPILIGVWVVFAANERWYLLAAISSLVMSDFLLMRSTTHERKHFEVILEEGYLSGGLGSSRS